MKINSSVQKTKNGWPPTLIKSFIILNCHQNRTRENAFILHQRRLSFNSNFLDVRKNSLLGDSLRLLHVVVINFFWLFYSIPLYEYTRMNSFILLMNGYLGYSRILRSWIMLLWTFWYVFPGILVHTFLSSTSLEMELLGQVTHIAKFTR